MTHRPPTLLILLLCVPFLGTLELRAQNSVAADPRERLSDFAGSWTVEGSEDTYRETCAWLTPGSFLVCRAEDTDPQDPGVSLSILGYSSEEQAYTYASFNGSGSSRILRAWAHGEKWIFTGGRERPGASIRWQITFTPNAEGFHFQQEVSENGGPWSVNYQTQYIRLP